MSANPNLPHVARVIRNGLAAYTGEEVELRIAADMDAAGLITGTGTDTDTDADADTTGTGTGTDTDTTGRPGEPAGPPAAREPDQPGRPDEPDPAEEPEQPERPEQPHEPAEGGEPRLPRQGVVYRRAKSRGPGLPAQGAASGAAAAGFGARCSRAEKAFEDLAERHRGRPEVLGIERDADRVVVCVRARTLADWEYWLTEIGAGPAEDTRQAGYAQLAFGSHAGVPVHLVAHEVPRLLHEAFRAAAEPYFLWGRVYDLSLPLVEHGGEGARWLFLGDRAPKGMPLLVVQGRTELCSLENIVRHAGPLSAVSPRGPALPPGFRGPG